MEFFTADLSDDHRDSAQVAEPLLTNYGGAVKCSGPIVTLRLNEHNGDLITLLKSEGNGRIAVVDVDAAYYAVVGENLMKFAHQNGWNGIVINGYVRDTHITRTVPVGLWALGTCPRKSHEPKPGELHADIAFAGVAFNEGAWLFADEDGIVVMPAALAKQA